jgi:hypothetical protein
MTKQHPITPSRELVEQWHSNSPLDRGLTLATQAAQWGADQELEACCEWLDHKNWWGESNHLRAARRPKPPSLKQQVLATLQYPKDLWSEDEVDAIRRLVEQLDD